MMELLSVIKHALMTDRKRGKEKMSRKGISEEKTGLLKKFLDWLARGAGKYQMGGTSCPT